MVDQQNSVSRCDPAKRNESNHRGDGQGLIGQSQRCNTADKRHRQGHHDLQRQVHAMKHRVQNQQHPHKETPNNTMITREACC